MSQHLAPLTKEELDDVDVLLEEFALTPYGERLFTRLLAMARSPDVSGTETFGPESEKLFTLNEGRTVADATALIEARNVLSWLDERGRNSRSYGSHADAYEIAARKLREALNAPPPQSFADICDDGPTAA